MNKTSGTREWAKRTCNIQVGCEHDCKYCYAKSMAIRFGRATAVGWHNPGTACAKTLPARRVNGVTMFPSAHDITERNAPECARMIERILESGDSVLVVTKGRWSALKVALSRVVGTQKKLVEVRVTIGSLDDEVLNFWEPGAACFQDRLDALIMARVNGFRTSVSLEPILDTRPNYVVNRVRDYADEIWIGLANDVVQRVSMNCAHDECAVRNAKLLEAHWTDKRVLWLVEQLSGDGKIRWKDSVRAVIERGTGHED